MQAPPKSGEGKRRGMKGRGMKRRGSGSRGSGVGGSGTSWNMAALTAVIQQLRRCEARLIRAPVEVVHGVEVVLLVGKRLCLKELCEAGRRDRRRATSPALVNDAIDACRRPCPVAKVKGKVRGLGKVGGRRLEEAPAPPTVISLVGSRALREHKAFRVRLGQARHLEDNGF